MKILCSACAAVMFAVAVTCVLDATGENFLSLLWLPDSVAQGIGKPFPALPIMGSVFLGTLRIALPKNPID